MMDLHGQIMNIKCAMSKAAKDMASDDVALSYKLGHRDARHAAAALALAADAEIERLRAALTWRPLEQEPAPSTGVIRLAVEAEDGERRTFVAEASHREDGMVWMITVGWEGWTRLHSEWRPTHWMPLQQP